MRLELLSILVLCGCSSLPLPETPGEGDPALMTQLQLAEADTVGVDTEAGAEVVVEEMLPVAQYIPGGDYVYSPHALDQGLVDVRGLPVDTPLKCPFTGKKFIIEPYGSRIIIRTD